VKETKLSRRGFVGAAAATGLASVLPASVAKADNRPGWQDSDNGRGGRKSLRIPVENRGIMLFSVRDAVARDPTTTDLPSGFRELFEYAALLGYQQVEFAGYTQHANADGGRGQNALDANGALNTGPFLAWGKQLRAWLDANGLRANGSHAWAPITPTDISNTPAGRLNMDRYKLELEFAATLGMENYGWPGDIAQIGSGPNAVISRYKDEWDVAVERWNMLGAIAKKQFGLRLYTHPHDTAYGFLLDRKPLDANGRPTRSSGKRITEYAAEIVDPRYGFWEIDIFWAYVGQHENQTYVDQNGFTRTDIFDPADWVAQHKDRVIGFHAKDGVRTGEAPGVGRGYDFVPFGSSGADGLPPDTENGIDFSSFYDRVGRADHVSFWEQDNAGGGAAKPMQSLTFAAKSYTGMVALGELGS
jgi:sugar phosphate isomerase/epimerase